MKQHLFITGPIQTGKSTLLQEALAPYRQHIGGFVSQRLKDESGRTMGFRLADYETAPSLTAPFNPELSDMFMIHESRRIIDLSVFEKKGVDIIERTMAEKKILLLDEIGGIELRSDTFKKALLDAFDKIPCIGVLKAPASAHNMRADAEKDNALLLDLLSKNGTIILSVGNWTHADALVCIQKHIKEILG